MSVLAPISVEGQDLPGLIDRAASMLSGAKTAAEVLEAREMAGLAYDVAKRAARLQRAKNAHDDLVAAAHRAQAHALEIEARAKRRLADEYDAAQERGDVAGVGGNRGNQFFARVAGDNAATAADLGLRRDQIHEARQIRDAEAADPGIIRRALDEQLERGEEPTRAALRKMVVDAAMRGLRPHRSPSRRNPLYVPPTPARAAWQHVTGTFRAFAEWATDEKLKPVPEAAVAAVGETLREQGLAVPAVGGGTTFLQAKTANEVLKAQERRLKLQQLKGELIDRDRANLVPAATASVVPQSIRTLTPISEPRLDAASATAWYLAASPNQIDTIEYAYLEGQQGAYIETRNGFDVDGVEIKCRLDFGAKAIDWRGLYKNAGA